MCLQVAEVKKAKARLGLCTGGPQEAAELLAEVALLQEVALANNRPLPQSKDDSEQQKPPGYQKQAGWAQLKDLLGY